MKSFGKKPLFLAIFDKKTVMTREKVIDSLEAMPDEFPLEDLLERLVFMQKVEEGLGQSEQGETTPIDEVKQRLRKWSA